MRYLIFLALLLGAHAVAAQTQQCLCTAGCKVVSGAYAAGTSQPTSCNIYKAGTLLVSGSMVASTTIPTNNASVCQPADPAYNPGTAGSMACVANIPAQAAGTTVALTVRGVNGAGEALDGAVLTFQSVSALPTVPPASTLRVTP
jgi:hypothetical protein